MINFLYEPCSCFNVPRKKVRKYLKSCLHAALHRDRSELISGIFSPETHADILEALLNYKHFKDDTCLALLRKSLPSALADAPPSQRDGKPYNTEAMRRRKIIKESLNNARQIVRWNANENCHEVSWITKKELLAEHGEQKANKMWENRCFKGTYKKLSGFQHPVTEGQALASWMNMGWSWESARAWWQQGPLAHMPPLEVDESSRDRIQGKLQKLLA